MKVALAQMTTGSDLETNLRVMENYVREAAAAGTRLVLFPEMAYFRGNRAQCREVTGKYETFEARFARWAGSYGLYLCPGSLREPVPGESDLCYNTAPLFNPRGERVARYRKIFLFRAELGAESYDESRYCRAGDEWITAELGEGWVLGLSLCYDIRFPEMYRALKAAGANAIAVPSSFTVPTGTAHWDILTRARAVENQVFLLCPAQGGTGGDGYAAYGHSRIVGPWGEVLAERKAGSGLIWGRLDHDQRESARRRVDCWASRREDLFGTGGGGRGDV